MGLIVEKYDFKKVGLILGVGAYIGGAYNERGLYNMHCNIIMDCINLILYQPKEFPTVFPRIYV